jgi:citrate synthase
MTRNLLTADQVARRLGVKLETVYAYVSRGVLTRTIADDGHTSRFDTGEVEELARRGRPRRERNRQGTVDVSLATAITGIVGNRLLFRGHDATKLAVSSTFEAVAELLWTGALPAEARWEVVPEKARVALHATRVLPATAGAIERLSVATAALASVHPLRVDLRPAAVVDHARCLVATFTEVLPARAAPPRGRAPTFAARLFPRLSSLSPKPARLALLDATLIVLADHELATSTLAARVAASTRADPFAVAQAGLGAVSGPLHGKAAVAAHRMILDAAASTAEAAVARAIETLGVVPGFRHPVYQGVDPRAACLLDRVRAILKPAALEVLHALARAGAKSAGAEPNVDFALAAVAFALEMPVGASEAVFAIARTAGWIAHALEEYGEEPLRFRAHSIYIGKTV